MAGGRLTVTIGIVALGERCTHLRSISHRLFQTVGSWVGSTDDAALQRIFAEGGHRHAWHTDLWRDRTPSIPPVDELAIGVPPTGVVADDDLARARHYHACLVSLREQLDELAADTDILLDPSTVRTVSLVASDIDDITVRLTRHLDHG